MIKGLAKATGILAFLLFIGGINLLPAIHRTYCTGHQASREAATCPICQFATAPTMTTSATVVPIGDSMVSDNADTLVSTLPVPSLRDATQARAPPVA